MKTTESEEERKSLATLDDVVRAIVRQEIAKLASQTREYTQHHRPAWAPTRLVYLRAWRELRAEGHDGVTAIGKARLMSQSAANHWLSRSAKPREVKLSLVRQAPQSLDDQVMRELGARRSAEGRR
jgi:hypothetical protein